MEETRTQIGRTDADMGKNQSTTDMRQQISLQEDEDVIDLREVFFLLRSRWKAIFLAMLAGAVLFGLYHMFLLKSSYQADTKIYITNTDSVISLSDLQLSSALTEDYADIITSRTVIKQVIKEMGLELSYDDLVGLIEVENPDDTHIIHTKVTCGDPELARNIANVLMNVSVEQIYQIIGSSEPTVIDYAEAEAVEDVTPSLKKFLVLGALAGAVLVCAVLVILMLMDTTLKSEEDVEKYLHLPVLAAVPYYDSKKL